MQDLWADPVLNRVTGEKLRPGGLTVTAVSLASLRLPPQTKILDAGCGAGHTVQWLHSQEWRAQGVDRSPDAVEKARRICPDASIHCADIMELPFPDNYFSVVLSECVISTLARPDLALKEMARVLQPEGHLVWSDLYLRKERKETPDLSRPPRAAGSCPAGARGRRDMEVLIERTGLQVRHFADHSQALAELAGRLILSGAAPLSALFNCTESCLTDLGYGFLLARKQARHE